MAIYFRAQAWSADPARTPRVQGSRAFTCFRIVGAIGMFTLFGFYIGNPSAIPWAFVSIPESIRWAGVIVAIVVIPFQYSVFKSLGFNLTPTAFPRENAHLVTTGPYRYVRHPLYLMAFVGFSSLTCISEVWILGVLLGVLCLFLIKRIPEEEKNLEEKFGQDYTDYKQKTKRLIPFLW